jgi:formylglycine-generating enzyme required for sulfatase activity
MYFLMQYYWTGFFFVLLFFLSSLCVIQAQKIALTPEKKLMLAAIETSMISIDGGVFIMGCTADQGAECTQDEFPVHQVQISSFRFSKTELTQGIWKAVMGINPSGNQRSDQFPVENVSYNDIDAFIERLNKISGHRYRLPTEAEWEFAARGGIKSRVTLYSGSSDPNNVSWNIGNSSNVSHIVGFKKANELGLYDMSGNVWEWCSDWYGVYHSSEESDPRGSVEGTDKIIRGGSYAGAIWFCRNAIRMHYAPSYKSHFIGFRLAEDVSE